MIINNPGILDGSVTTSKIADGAVTNAKITGPISIANGGTGTATPGDTAGNNVSITGSFPNETIGTIAVPQFDSMKITNNAGGNSNRLELSSASASHYIYSTGEGGNETFFGEYGGTFNFENSQSSTVIAKLDPSGLTLPVPLATSEGGTGAASLAAAKIPEVIYQNSVGATVISTLSVGTLSAPATGTYLIIATGHVDNAGGTSANAYAEALNGSGGTPGRGRSGDMAIAGGGNDDVTVCAMISANAGDSLEANIVTTAGGTITLSGSMTILRMT